MGFPSFDGKAHPGNVLRGSLARVEQQQRHQEWNNFQFSLRFRIVLVRHHHNHLVFFENPSFVFRMLMHKERVMPVFKRGSNLAPISFLPLLRGRGFSSSTRHKEADLIVIVQWQREIVMSYDCDSFDTVRRET